MKTIIILLSLILLSSCASISIQDSQQLTKAQVKQAIKAKVKCKVIALDNQYNALSLQDIERALYTDTTDHGKYVPELNDCDDFALKLMSGLSEYCVGIAMVRQNDGQMHMVNVFVTSDLMVHFVDPQTDKFLGEDEFKRVYMVMI